MYMAVRLITLIFHSVSVTWNYVSLLSFVCHIKMVYFEHVNVKVLYYTNCNAVKKSL